jgi:glycosyltransferase involved in cell wall biosynthesis
VRFTILLPTTGDRGPLLPFVVRSVQLQTVSDWELIIVGDGVNDDSRAIIQGVCAADPRVRFHDRPKHARRGEVYRHEVLATARGELVAYVTDRDLWFYDHLETLAGALAAHDFAHTLAISAQPDGSLAYGVACDLGNRAHRAATIRFSAHFALSAVGHTLPAYRRLPHGWRTTPLGIRTDGYMWTQFLEDPSCSATSVDARTVLYFWRGDHPGLATPARAIELKAWSRRLGIAASQRALRDEVHRDLSRPLPRLEQAAGSWLAFRPRTAKAYMALRAGMKRLGLP